MRTLATLHDEHALRGRVDDAAPVTSASTVLIDAPAARVRDVTVQESPDGPLIRLFYGERKLRAGHEARLAALKDHIERSA